MHSNSRSRPLFTRGPGKAPRYEATCLSHRTRFPANRELWPSLRCGSWGLLVATRHRWDPLTEEEARSPGPRRGGKGWPRLVGTSRGSFLSARRAASTCRSAQHAVCWAPVTPCRPATRPTSHFVPSRGRSASTCRSAQPAVRYTPVTPGQPTAPKPQPRLRPADPPGSARAAAPMCAWQSQRQPPH